MRGLSANHESLVPFLSRKLAQQLVRLEVRVQPDVLFAVRLLRLQCVQDMNNQRGDEVLFE